MSCREAPACFTKQCRDDVSAPDEVVHIKMFCLHRQELSGNLPEEQFLPEESVMLDADLPQLLGSSVVRKLEADRTFKLLILEAP